MSILNVDKIQPIGSGSTVTVNATDTILTNAQAGVITATTFSGSGSTIDNIQIGVTGGNEIDTSSGNLTIDSAGGTTNITDVLNVTGSHVNLETGSASTQMQLRFGTNTEKSRITVVAATNDGYTGSTAGETVFNTNSQLSFSALGSQALTITSGRNIGIGTATPTAKLDVYGSGSTSVIRGRRTDSNGGWNIFEGYSDINGANVFTVSNNGVGYFKGGIDFSAQTSSSASGATTTGEVLNHYEIGTWTPVLTNGFTYQTLSASYTRIGNVVNIFFNLYRNDSSSKSSDLEVTGLPFAMASSSVPFTNSMGLGIAASYNGSSDRRIGFINTNNASSVKVIKDGTSVYVSYDNFVANSRALTMKWWYYTA